MSLLSPKLEAFAAIARAGTVHGAATRLHLTQTGVTQRLRALERELGTTLFLRSRRGMTLTAEGEALLRYCRGARELEGEVAGQIGQGGTHHPVPVTVVGPSSVVAARIVPQSIALYRRFPQLQLHFRFTDASGRLRWLRRGDADLAITPPGEVPREMASKRLKADRYLLVAAPDWKGRPLREILTRERIIDFAEDDPTTHNYLQRFGLDGPVRPPRLFVNNNQAIIELFAAGTGYGTLTEETARPHLAAGRLIRLNRGAVMEDPLALAWYPRPEMPEYFRAIVRAIR